MLEELKACPVCHGTSFKDFITCKDFTVSHQDFSIVSCKTCEFKFTNPRPETAGLASYYESEEYISHANKRTNLINTAYKLARSFTLKGKLRIVNTHSIKGVLLDVGCGTGEFLNTCKTDGWQISGVEPNNGAKAKAEQLNKEKFYHSIFDIDRNESFHAITLWHVLEHLPNLQQSLKKINELLTQDGTVFIAVPNSNSYDAQHYQEYWAAYDVPRHLFHFEQKTINKLFKENNFILQKIIPMKLDSYYVSLLSEKYKNGANNYLSALVQGFKSNQWAKKNNNNYSSLIYVVRKKI
ncbi:class I SAM-dependent methyltransferase [Fulvivirgaceae bacterium BMA10]|uniref:Class I SAM-dependent methyltransferase n=1 Tax=Splendidivirga corallicola TaxID=3051826 RepID=A0ABT8KQT4_9BACT|nr:class I SAM-dependent methyltransferase [Fulvivirgaceae bacterium BMA10]